MTWLENDDGGSSFHLGDKQRIDTVSIVCTVREVGQWDGKNVSLTAAKRLAILTASEEEQSACVRE